MLTYLTIIFSVVVTAIITLRVLYALSLPKAMREMKNHLPYSDWVTPEKATDDFRSSLQTSVHELLENLGSDYYDAVEDMEDARYEYNHYDDEVAHNAEVFDVDERAKRKIKILSDVYAAAKEYGFTVRPGLHDYGLHDIDDRYEKDVAAGYITGPDIG